MSGKRTSFKAMRSIILLLFIFLWLPLLFSQDNSIFFRHLTSNDGLSHNTVYAINEDDLGFIWIGTRSGLNRFDGSSFKIYDNNNFGLRNGYINIIFKDSKGRMWFGTQEGGLSRYNIEQDDFTTYTFNPDDPGSLNHNNIHAISEDSRGNIWAGSHEDDLYRINEDQGSLERIHLAERLPGGYQIERITSMYFDSDTMLWLGTFGGLFSFNQVTGKLRPVYSNEGFVNSRIICMFTESQNKVWLGTTTGIVRYDKKNHHVDYINTTNSSLSNDQVLDIERLPDGRIIIATDGGGLNIYYPGDGTITALMNDPNNSLTLSNNSVYDIYVDKFNGLWVGNYLGGINYYNKFDWKFLPIRHQANDAESLSDNHVRTFLQDREGNIWIGTLGGLNLYNPNTSKFKSYTSNRSVSHSLSSNTVLAIYEDYDGLLWIGTFGGGISIFNKAKNTFTKFGHPDDVSGSLDKGSVYSIKEINDNKLCFGSLGGIYVLDRNNGTLKRYTSSTSGLSNNTVKVLCKDRFGNLWIGTNRGLNRFNTDTEEFEIYFHTVSDPNSLSNNMILSIMEASDGKMWIGTEGGGVSIFDPGKGTFKSITSADGLPDNVINGILEDDNGVFWFSTNKGLVSFEPASSRIKTYTAADGLQGNEFNQKACYKARDGKLYFGGSTGFNAFFPESLIMNEHPPRVFLTELYISNKLIKVGGTESPLEKQLFMLDKITLSYNQSNLEFRFSALGFINAGKYQYSYIMDGLDEGWTDFRKNQSAIYSNLEPGIYTFMVRAVNTDGINSQDPASIAVRIMPPWYKSWWAYMVYSLVIILLMMLFLWINTLRINAKQQLALELIEKEHQEQLNQLKMGFFTNISHEFKTPLTLILGHLDIMKSAGTERKVETINKLEREAKRLLYLINQLLEFRKAESGLMKLRASKTSIVQLLESIRDSFDNLARKKNIQFEMSFNGDIPELWIDTEKMEKILFNLLSNAFKYTDEGGIVSVHACLVHSPDFKRHEGTVNAVEISVKDSGIGIAPDAMAFIFNRSFQSANKKDENKTIESSGIGLAFSKRLVELHHGDITVESELGKGSVFKLRLPLGKDHLHDEEIKEDVNFHLTMDYKSLSDEIVIQPLVHADDDKTDNHMPVLLVVDDNPQVCKILADKFRPAFHVLMALNGKEGLEAAKKSLPDIIISDIMMPVMDGIEFCKNIKKDIQTSHIPVILLTAKSGDENQIIGLKTGADAYFSKPYNPDLLQVTVENLMNNRKRLREKFAEKPDFIPADMVTNKLDVQFLEKIIKLIEDDSESDMLDVTTLSREMAMSRSVLYRKLKSITGNSIQDFVRVVKLRKAARLLVESDYPISEISFLSGFPNSKHFSTAFKKQFSKTPSQYRSGEL